MADKQKSIFSAAGTLIVTLVLFSLLGSYVVDLAVSGSPRFVEMANQLAIKAATQYLHAVQHFEGVSP